MPTSSSMLMHAVSLPSVGFPPTFAPRNSSSSFAFSFPQKISHFSAPSFSSVSNKKAAFVPSRASSDDPNLLAELPEDGKFVPVNPEDPNYGPPALLLVGFKVEESDKIHQMLRDLEGEFMQVIYCTEDMLTRSVWDAVHTGKQNLENIKIARSVPRICFLSGLTGEETMMFMDAFSESDVEPAIFAAMVPNSANKPLEEVIDEIKGDHEMVTAAAKQPGI